MPSMNPSGTVSKRYKKAFRLPHNSTYPIYGTNTYLTIMRYRAISHWLKRGFDLVTQKHRFRERHLLPGRERPEPRCCLRNPCPTVLDRLPSQPAWKPALLFRCQKCRARSGCHLLSTPGNGAGRFRFEKEYDYYKFPPALPNSPFKCKRITYLYGRFCLIQHSTISIRRFGKIIIIQHLIITLVVLDGAAGANGAAVSLCSWSSGKRQVMVRFAGS